MQLINSIKQLKVAVREGKHIGKVGFVPTMGALHKGHISLVEKCASENYLSIVSIYVNPTQFNDKEDLKRYPRNLDYDLKMLEGTGCNFVFAPDDSEMYPEPDNRKFNFGELETVMEGRFRPGHFNGVAQIVSKFFYAVEPDRAYFGLKDFQQLAIIKKMVQEFNFPVDIIPCPIVREPDGLAMSSRNALLEPDKRLAAPVIYKTLQEVAKMAAKRTPGQIKDYVNSIFESNNKLKIEYFDIVDDASLQSVNNFDKNVKCSACIAVFAGKIRLIDNIQINL